MNVLSPSIYHEVRDGRRCSVEKIDCYSVCIEYVKIANQWVAAIDCNPVLPACDCEVVYCGAEIVRARIENNSSVVSIETLPSTPRRSPSPRWIDVPAWITRIWLDCTRYPSGSEIVPLHTVVERVRPADVPDKIGASRSIRTSETAKRMGNAIRNQG